MGPSLFHAGLPLTFRLLRFQNQVPKGLELMVTGGSELSLQGNISIELPPAPSDISSRGVTVEPAYLPTHAQCLPDGHTVH